MTSIKIRKYVNPAFLSVIVIVLLFVTQIIRHKNSNQDKNLKEDFKTETFKTSDGFGYYIKLNDQVIIKQEIIPAISVNVAFKTEKDAENTANLVIQKIKNKKVPSVNREELDSLGIKY